MNQTNMQDKNDVIRYLMKEMDPSEEVLMERAMMQDDDLLIEVESMRQTLHRLDDLPEKAPPAELSESIIEQAAEHKKHTSRWPTIPKQMLKYAAVLLIGAGLGSGAWMLSSSTNDISKPAPVSSADAATSTAASKIKSWTDHHNVIYYQDEFSKSGSGKSVILEASMDKLKPVEDHSALINPDARGVHLTGAHK